MQHMSKKRLEFWKNLKSIVHPKMKILSSFTHPSLVYEFLFFCWTQKKIFWGMLVTKQPLTSMVFFSISWKSTKIHFYFYAHSNVILYSYTINLKCKFPIMIASSIKKADNARIKQLHHYVHISIQETLFRPSLQHDNAWTHNTTFMRTLALLLVLWHRALARRALYILALRPSDEGLLPVGAHQIIVELSPPVNCCYTCSVELEEL